MNYVTGKVIRELREKKQLTQKQLADELQVSDKTISKWETDRGLPDIGLIGPLARVLGVSVAEILVGEYAVNDNRSANMRKGSFYVCPVCGNVIWSVGQGAYGCCGITLPALEAESMKTDKAEISRKKATGIAEGTGTAEGTTRMAEGAGTAEGTTGTAEGTGIPEGGWAIADVWNQQHELTIEIVENEYYVHMEHPMTKEHYISFIAHVTADRTEIVKLYPEQGIECRFQRTGRGSFYAYCNQHGLYRMNL